MGADQWDLASGIRPVGSGQWDPASGIRPVGSGQCASLKAKGWDVEGSNPCSNRVPITLSLNRIHVQPLDRIERRVGGGQRQS